MRDVITVFGIVLIVSAMGDSGSLLSRSPDLPWWANLAAGAVLLIVAALWRTARDKGLDGE